ncbi:glutathione S-transferase family protein [Caulobacter sp. X]|uniref:glutathione S-transferase family protein n=1 Tax=Caulobacter sp. X TaxID=2048901 RepID=UPI000C14D12B|nr:glutathione S-transferase [Caulobacter sp. X]PIC01063.1 glutathione S-transferase [Caulobacter sp. X]
MTIPRVLGRASSLNVRKVLWTLDELDQAYEREDWGAGFASTRDPKFLAMNPNALVPVLIDEHGALWESNTICRYLATGTPLLPEGKRARAIVEQWMDWQATELNTAWRYAFAGLVRKAPGFDDPKQIAASVEAWNTAMGLLDARLVDTGAYVAGEHFSLADIVLGLALHRWLHSPIQRVEWPALTAYYERLKQRPAFAAWSLPEVP